MKNITKFGKKDPDPDPTLFFSDFKDAKNLFFSYLFLITYPQAHNVQS